MTLTFEKSVVIDAPVDKVFAYVTDLEHLPEFWEGIDEVKDIHQLPNGDLAMTGVGHMLGLRIEATGEAVEFEPNKRVVVKVHSGSLYDGTVTLDFEGLEDEETRIHGTGEYTFTSGGPLAKLGEPFLAKYVDHAGEMTVAAAKARIEAEA